MAVTNAKHMELDLDLGTGQRLERILRNITEKSKIVFNQLLGEIWTSRRPLRRK
jgi:hypothetical protein